MRDGGKPYMVNGAVEMRSLIPSAREVPKGVRDSLARTAEIWAAEEDVTGTEISPEVGPGDAAPPASKVATSDEAPDPTRG